MMVLGAGTALALSVAMHVSWNLLARHQPKDSYPLWWVLLGHLLLLGPWGMYTLLQEVQWDTPFSLLLGISVCANVVYFLSLDRAYRQAPVALVYPLVRSSPLLIAVWSTLLLQDSLPVAAWLGIAISVAGLLLLAGSSWQGPEKRAVPWALLAMLATSVYSLSDKAATSQLSSFGSVLGFISFGYLASWLAISITLKANSGRWIPRGRLSLPVIVVGGLCVGLAYALVIHAMRQLPAAEVVAYTNAGIVVASAVSIFIFKEKAQWQRRLLSGLLICSGLLVVAIGRA
ncbi:EamA family transporter [Lacisediminimonas profundi]|uniref:EamA family transporter n=1 Tax=Lacisediminimonas profundi TaxID=2603856 RepID=UPI00124BB326|nr:EamA family transporter [Lacisediminimonas profundi]